MSIRDFLKMLSGHGVVTALVLVAVPLASLVKFATVAAPPVTPAESEGFDAGR